MKVTVTTRADPAPRRRPTQVLKVVDLGASPYGSTFHKSLLACPREHGLSYVAKIKPEILADALTAGWLWHHCLELLYRTLQEHQRVSNAKFDSDEFLFGGWKAGIAKAFHAIDAFSDEPGYDDIEGDVRRMLIQYDEMYAGRDRWVILAVEETIIYEGEINYSTRLDLLIQDLDRDGAMFICEHKSARMVTSELLDNYQLDLQILGQVWLLKKCVDLKRYPRFAGVRINIATKHKTPQLVRVDVAPSDAHLKAFYDAQVQWGQLRKAMQAMGWPRSLGHCAGYARGYSRCQYFDLCHGQPATTVAQWAKGEAPYGFVREGQP